MAQKKRVEDEIKALNKTLATLQFKEWYYTNVKQDGTTDRVKNMTLDELPEKFRKVRKELRGN